MKFYDCHIHSEFSIDGVSTIEEIVKSAIKKGAAAITITDHSLPKPEKYAPYEHIKKSVSGAKEAKEKYKDEILVLSGVERDDEYPPEYREPFYDFDADCILGSVHSEPTFKKYFADCGYKSLKYCAKVVPLDFLKNVVKRYYERLAGMAHYADVDVITHLTFPFRYINGQAKRGLDITPFYSQIDEVLDGVIRAQKSLEVNTSGKATEWNEFMPNADILKRYFDMGGRNITLGSDAHKAENIAVGFNEANKMLKEIGFLSGSYYVKRKRYEYML